MIHHVFANRSNIGDWLSAMGIQRLLAPLPIAEYLCDGPFVPATLAALACVPPTDVIVIGGGGLFMDYFEPFWRGFLDLVGERPFCIWGAGCCSMRFDDSRIDTGLARRAASRAAICSVRDELTAEVLGRSSAPVLCPSIAVLSAPEAPAESVLHSCSFEDTCPNAYWGLRLAARRFSTEHGRTYAETNNRIEADSRVELQRTLDLYARADTVFSARLHGCIVASAFNRKLVAVAQDWKINEFMKAIGLSEWVVPFHGIDRLPEIVDNLERQPTVAGKMAESIAANRGVASRIRDLHSQVQQC